MTLDIVTRDEAGLAAPRGTLQPMTLPVGEVWLHHSVTEPSGDPLADWRRVQEIGFARGFADVSYSFGFHPDGTVLEGRGTMVGAHTLNHNASGFGLVLIGNYDEMDPTQAQIDAVREWVAMAKANGWVRPGEYPTGGHRDVFPTACPGSEAYRMLGAFRSELADAGQPVEAPHDVPVPPLGSFVRPGSTGPTVAAVQDRLSRRGWDLVVDGLYGPATGEAIRAFQSWAGLTIDGVVGPETWTALWTLRVDEIPAMVPIPPPAPPVLPSPDFPPFLGVVGLGSRGEAVRAVQDRLAERGWRISVDGIFGPGTQAVVRAFQIEKGLVPDAIVGPATWEALWTAPV